MQQDSFPHPVSDPEADGVPEVADDDSTAYDGYPSVREADGPSPAPLPADREHGPVVLDDYGVTADEEVRGETLDTRLRREEPDVWSGAETPLTMEELDGGPIAANAGSPVSVYDNPDTASEHVGRLVAPDGGGTADVDPEEFAFDAGPAGGGPTMEELAIHPVAEPSGEVDEAEYGDR
ncbi:DUF5709 domain-containing protein [Luedemannella helvata]|uniref:DUF5709 domain-containing protein n=1 Tax=Luedemannella helvata TaxID=349315 RepID=A0ABN2L4K7_9ACTN